MHWHGANSRMFQASLGGLRRQLEVLAAYPIATHTPREFLLLWRAAAPDPPPRAGDHFGAFAIGYGAIPRTLTDRSAVESAIACTQSRLSFQLLPSKSLPPSVRPSLRMLTRD
eukprot:3367687-Rhodomonas_salina.2